MPHQKFVRLECVEKIVYRYKGLYGTPEKSQSWNEFKWEIAATFNVSEKTAIEYMRTAIAQQMKNAKDAQLLTTEEVEVMNAEPTP